MGTIPRLSGDEAHYKVICIRITSYNVCYTKLLRIYPVAYADEQAIEYEKRYNLWALSMRFTDQYFKYINRLLRFF